LARYVSRSPKYSIGVTDPEMTQVNGLVFESTPKKIAKFTQGVALDHGNVAILDLRAESRMAAEADSGE